jgi:hypothetical protein
MRFGSPGAQAYGFERDGAIETFLMRPVNYTLTAPADFLQQFIVAKVLQHFCCSRTVFSPRHGFLIGRVFILVVEQTKAGL